MSANIGPASKASRERARPGAASRRLARMALRAMLLSVLIAAASAPASLAGAPCVGSDLEPVDVGLPAYSQTTLCLINAQRAANDLPVLARNSALDGAATAYSHRMVAGSFFDHVAPDRTDLTDRLAATDYMAAGDRWVVGENLAWGTGTLSTPSAVVVGWMASPGHRANILSADYCDIGLGVTLGTPSDPSTGVTVTTNFGAVHVGAPARRLAFRRGVTVLPRPAGHCRPSPRARRLRSGAATSGRGAVRHAAPLHDAQ
jgi:uncharacterized protein YkwD